MGGASNTATDVGLVADLYSDTQTRPTPQMRQVIAQAAVGDEQSGQDPTVRALEERTARLLGQESAVFLPTGTMCNLIGLRLHVTGAGDEVLMAEDAHPIHYEAAGLAAVNGAMVRTLPARAGIFEAQALQSALRPRPPRHAPTPRVVSIEQTTNMGGGRVWPLPALAEIVGVAREHGLAVHLDGARLLNAAVASGQPAESFGSLFDTVWIDFTKGLGAPFGACLAGSSQLMTEAWRYKQMFGGAMRQAGIVAAGALYSLNHHVERLADDHRNARWLAQQLSALDGVDLDPQTVQTNIVIVGVPDATTFVGRLAERGVRLMALDERRVRAVTHLDVDGDALEVAMEVIADELESRHNGRGPTW